LLVTADSLPHFSCLSLNLSVSEFLPSVLFRRQLNLSQRNWWEFYFRLLDGKNGESFGLLGTYVVTAVIKVMANNFHGVSVILSSVDVRPLIGRPAGATAFLCL